MGSSGWFDNIVFNTKASNDGLLRVDFMSTGMECYYKKITTKEFKTGKYNKKFEKNPSSIKEDGMEVILNNSNLEYEVDLNGKAIKKLDSLNGKEKLIKTKNNNWVEFLNIDNVEDDDYLMIWGHSGVCGYTFKFENVEKFYPKKLSLNIESFDDGNGIKEYFLGIIQYDAKEPSDVEVTFEPKYGFWGPVFLNSKV